MSTDTPKITADENGSHIAWVRRIWRVAISIHEATDGQPWTLNGVQQRWVDVTRCRGLEVPGMALFLGRWMTMLFWMTKTEHARYAR